MGAIFSKPKAPPPDPEIRKSQLRQEKILARQEANTIAEEKAEKDKLRRRRKLKQGGGLNLLLSPDRDEDVVQQGLTDKLGSNY
jgi:hypothetical protein